MHYGCGGFNRNTLRCLRRPLDSNVTRNGHLLMMEEIHPAEPVERDAVPGPSSRPDNIHNELSKSVRTYTIPCGLASNNNDSDMSSSSNNISNVKDVFVYKMLNCLPSRPLKTKTQSLPNFNINETTIQFLNETTSAKTTKASKDPCELTAHASPDCTVKYDSTPLLMCTAQVPLPKQTKNDNAKLVQLGKGQNAQQHVEALDDNNLQPVLDPFVDCNFKQAEHIPDGTDLQNVNKSKEGSPSKLDEKCPQKKDKKNVVKKADSKDSKRKSQPRASKFERPFTRSVAKEAASMVSTEGCLLPQCSQPNLAKDQKAVLTLITPHRPGKTGDVCFTLDMPIATSTPI
jgi:hypothetical protein